MDTAPIQSSIETDPPFPSSAAEPAFRTRLNELLDAEAPSFTKTATSSKFWRNPFSPAASVNTVPSAVTGVEVETVEYCRSVTVNDPPTFGLPSELTGMTGWICPTMLLNMV